MAYDCGIYKIENLINGKVYIGQAIDLNHRRIRHFSDLKCNRHENQHLQNAYNKYGKDNFIFKVLLYCEPFELTRYEQALVDITSNIYNICLECVNSCKGITRSERFKKNLSDIFTGHTGYFTGRQHTEESKKKMGDGNRGKKRTPEQIITLSEAHKGNPGFWTGKKLSEEHK